MVRFYGRSGVLIAGKIMENMKMYVQKIPWEANYDESQMPAYTLPDVLRCQDGSMVKTADEWMKKRRPELLQMFKNVMYGELPPLPDRVRYELISEKRDARGGKAVRREVRIHLEMNDGCSHSIDMLYYLPAQAVGKVPVFVGLTFIGNHVVTDEPDILITGTAGFWFFSRRAQLSISSPRIDPPPK